MTWGTSASPFWLPAPVWRSVVVLSLLGLASCTVGAAYKRPSVVTVRSFPGFDEDGSAAAQNDAALSSWWTAFKDPRLNALIEEARSSNPDLAEAAARLEKARASLGAARADAAPQIDGEADQTYKRISPIGLPEDRTSGDPAGRATILNLSAQWEIDFWGRYRRATEAARARLLASSAGRAAVLISIEADVASSYFALLELDERRRYLDHEAELDRRAVALVRQKEAAGFASRQETHTAELTLQRVTERGADAKRQTFEEEARLAALLGRAPGSVARIASIWDEPLPAVSPGLPAQLLERRPDLRQAEADLIAANADIGVAEAAYFPNISLTAEGGYESAPLSQLFTANAETWLLQPSLNLPIFTGGRIKAAVRMSRAEKAILVARYRGAVIAAFRDVSKALVARKAALERLHSALLIKERAAQDSTLEAERLQAGVAAKLETIKAEIQADDARLEAASKRGDALHDLVVLCESLGGGWS